jgi:hypothetical protein
MQLVVRVLTLGIMALGLRSAAGQFAPSPGQRGDAYQPSGPSAQVQVPQRYPLPPPPGYVPPAEVTAAPPMTSGPNPARPPIASPLPAAPPVAAAQFAPPVAAPPAAAGQIPAGIPGAGPMDGPPGPSSPVAGAELFEPTRTVAIVGDRHILYGEIGPTVEQILAPLSAQITNDFERSELEKLRENLTRQYLQQYVNTKLMYLEFERQLEKNAGRDKLVEARTGIERKMRDSFEKDLLAMREKVASAKPERIQELMRRDPTLPRLAMLMKQHQCETVQELDAVLRQYGSSLDKQIRFYGENNLGRMTLGRQITTNPEVTHQEMLDYYAANADEFAVPAKAKFELLTVKFANHPTRNDAWNKLAQMGNEVYFGAPFATIAKKHSEEPRAKDGGAYDWTTKGSLASKVIDQALFTLEPGKLSQILEDERGVHIVRVIEREEEHQVAFLDAQPSIKEAIVLKKREEDFKKALESQRVGVTIWTIYDEQPELARQPYQPGDSVPR